MDNSKTEPTSENKATLIESPKIDIKEGAKITGYGEKFDVNLISGTSSLSIPIPCPPMREISPSLYLSYTGTKQNGAFGLGFAVPLPTITRMTNKGLPSYTQNDRFMMSSSELTPAYKQKNGQWIKDEREQDGYKIIAFRPRLETSFQRIEWWISPNAIKSHWVVVDANNAISVYGQNDSSRICDSKSPERIFQWAIDHHIDAKGNKIVYKYQHENLDNCPLNSGSDSNVQIYISSILYGNYLNNEGEEEYLAEVAFDYGDYDLTMPSLQPVKKWAVRHDAFSSYRSGFDIRTRRLCHNVLFIRHLPDKPELGDCLNTVLHLEYSTDERFSFLKEVQLIGYRKDKAGTYQTETQPPLRLEYGKFELNKEEHRTLKVIDGTCFPALPGKGHYQFVDIWGQGLPGLLYNDKDTVSYWSALGDGQYAPPVSPFIFPIDRDLSSGSCTLMDIEGTGRRDLVVRSKVRSGFYRNNQDQSWGNFVPFASITPEFTSSSTEMTDFNGDGRLDLMVQAEEHRLRIYESRGTCGFSAPELRNVPVDFPFATKPQPRTLTAFGNIFGDGLQHRIHLEDGLLTVWPSLGKGTFGQAQFLTDVPRFTDDLSMQRIFLADVTGAGFDDLVIVHNTYISIYLNQSGNGFGTEMRLPAQSKIDDSDQVNFADVTGHGKIALIISKATQKPIHYFQNISAHSADYLLTRVDNALGKTIDYQYCCSTLYRLAAEKAGKPWATMLGIPVNVVKKVTVSEKHTGLKQISEYEYADGYYDQVEREFRGFAYTEQWDYLLLQSNQGLEETIKIEPVPQQECTLTRQWNNTGAIGKTSRSVSIPQYQNSSLVPPDVLDLPILSSGTDTVREAYGALGNRQVATSVSGLDTDGLAREYSYLDSASNYLVTMLQPRLDGHYGAFLVNPIQTRACNSEAGSTSPKLEDKFNLLHDEFGNVTLAVTANYGLKNSEANAPDAQGQLILTATTTDYINRPAEITADCNYIGQTYQAKNMELSGIKPAQDLFSFDELLAQIPPVLTGKNVIDYGLAFDQELAQSRPINWTRHYFWNEQQDQVLPLGNMAAHGLLHHQQNAVFPDSFVHSTYGDLVNKAMLEASGGAGCGYIFEDDYWWDVDSKRHFGDRSAFHSIMNAEDAFGGLTSFSYDMYFLNQTVICDALGQKIQMEIDYQTFEPWRLIDINGNVTERAFSPLGRTIAVSTYGHYDGKLYGDRSLENYVYLLPKDSQEVIADPEKYLQGAGSYIYVDFFSSLKGKGPVSCLQVEASSYEKPLNQDKPDLRTYDFTISFYDGYARPLAAAIRVEAEALENTTESRNDTNSWSWICSGQVLKSPKGLDLRRYKSFVLNDDNFIANPPAPYDLSFYDAMGRAIKQLSAKGFISRTIYRPWEKLEYDNNDAILDSPYYKDNINNHDPSFTHERDALLKSECFKDTPSTFLIDPLGRNILLRNTIIDSLTDGEQALPQIVESGLWLDVAGNTLRTVDAHRYNQGSPILYNFQWVYDMTGRRITERSLDCGKDSPGLVRNLPCTGEGLLRQWDHTGLSRQWTYDCLRRPVGMQVFEGNANYLAEAMVYGSDQNLNNCGQMIKTCDQALVSSTDGFDLQGKPLSSTVKFPVAWKGFLDWTEPEKIAMQDESWKSSILFNRRNWRLQEISPDGSVQKFTYYQNGWLQQVEAIFTNEENAQPVVKAYVYAADGQVKAADLGNGARSEFEYDTDTRKLQKQITWKALKGERIQDLSYYYDGTGNITRVIDDVLPSLSQLHEAPKPINDYTYDSIYRIRQARGRRQITGSTHGTIKNLDFKAQLNASLNKDPNYLVAYTEHYDYDLADNLYRIKHQSDAGSGQGSWTKNMVQSDNSNHMVPKEMLDGTGLSVDDFFDHKGNMTELPGLKSIQYDCRGKMTSVTLDTSTISDDDANYYTYDQSGARRRRVRQRTINGGSVSEIEETLYLGTLVVTRTRKTTAGETVETASSRTLNICGIEQKSLLVVNKDVTMNSPHLLRFQIGDIRQSVNVELDGSADILTWEEYYPYGDLAVSLGLKSALKSKIYRYIGRELDRDTGLYCLGQRYYMPWMGRWLTPDPLGAKGGLNLYAYGLCNPLNQVDRSGLAPTTTQQVRGRGDMKITKKMQTTINNDVSASANMVDRTITTLESRFTRPNWFMSMLGCSGTVRPYNAATDGHVDWLDNYFHITGDNTADASRVSSLIDKYKKIKDYLERPAPNKGIIIYLRSFFRDTPSFVVHKSNDPAVHNVLAYVHSKVIRYPDSGILPESYRSSPVGRKTLIGLHNTYYNLRRRMSADDGIHFNVDTHFGGGNANERRATIIHEASHIVLMTADFAYASDDDPAAIFRLSTSQAMNNADSLAEFARQF